MKAYRDFKPGEFAVFNEDGGYAVVEVLSYEDDGRMDAFELRCVHQIQPSPSQGPFPPASETMSVCQVRGVGFAGMWFLRTVEEFLDGRPKLRADLAPWVRQ